MSKLTITITLLFQFAFSSIGFCNQKNLDLSRSNKIEAVIEAVHTNNSVKLASVLPGLSEKEATEILKKLSEHWHDKAKIIKTDRLFPKEAHKGNMRLIVHWGSRATQTGKWQNLKSIADLKHHMRIGLLFDKGSSEPRQLVFEDYRKSKSAK